MKKSENIQMNINEYVLRKTLPVIICVFNQYTYLKNLISKLNQNGFFNIYVLDQKSTYQPLINYLKDNNGKNFTVFYESMNYGPHNFFVERKYQVFSGMPFLYTDPDIDFNYLAPNFLTKFFELSNLYKVFKVGSALYIPKDSEIKPGISLFGNQGNKISVENHERQFWVSEIQTGVYNSPIDTTLHVFFPEYYKEEQPLITGLRVGLDGFVIKHLPWHKDDPMPEDELNFYLQEAKHNSWR